MGQILKDKNNDSNDSRLIPKKNAKSVFVVDSENNLHKLQEAVEQLDELEILGENPTEVEIQKSLMANNWMQSYEFSLTFPNKRSKIYP